MAVPTLKINHPDYDELRTWTDKWGIFRYVTMYSNGVRSSKPCSELYSPLNVPLISISDGGIIHEEVSMYSLTKFLKKYGV